MTGLVYSLFLGKRRGFGTSILSFKPHNVSFVIQGTVLLWVGWIGFNGGSTFGSWRPLAPHLGHGADINIVLPTAANVKAGLAIVNTNLAAGMGGLTWMLLDFRLERKWSAVGFCTGAICGLVAITPAAGFVSPGPAIFIGVVASATSNLLTTLKGFFVSSAWAFELAGERAANHAFSCRAPQAFDDAMDIYAVRFSAGSLPTFAPSPNLGADPPHFPSS